jgi:hypothetical protein
MDTFSWLLIGHLVGDWILQNHWMAQGKKQDLLTLAGIVHGIIYTVTIMGALWLSGAVGQRPAFYLVLSALVFVSHWLVDATNAVERWMRFYRQSELTMIRVMVDQTVHVLVLVLVAGLSLKCEAGHSFMMLLGTDLLCKRC